MMFAIIIGFIKKMREPLSARSQGDYGSGNG
jgi:hypothetical protein